MSSNNKLLPNEKLTIEENNLKRIITWINASDVKVAAVITFQIFLIGFIANKSTEIKTIWIKYQINNDTFLLFLLLLIYIVSSIFSAYFSFKALYPDVTPRGGISLLFFGTIPILGREKFKKEFKKLTVENLEDEILDQTFINAEIASSKHQYVRKGIFWLFLAGISCVFILMTIAFLS